MQQDGIIRIKKPPENRGLLGKVRALIARLSKWFAGAMGKKPEAEGTALGSSAGNPLLSPPSNGNKGTIKIKGRKKGVTGTTGNVTQDTVIGGNGIVVVASDVPKCNACKEDLNDGRPTARCSRNKQHVIHSDCVVFMKYKCPYCGSRIAGYPRPAAGG